VIKFYFNLAHNPMKVALLLEELGLPYEPAPVDSHKGEQFAPDYLAANPNGKVHAQSLRFRGRTFAH
jgi:GST-like protein